MKAVIAKKNLKETTEKNSLNAISVYFLQGCLFTVKR